MRILFNGDLNLLSYCNINFISEHLLNPKLSLAYCGRSLKLATSFVISNFALAYDAMSTLRVAIKTVHTSQITP